MSLSLTSFTGSHLVPDRLPGGLRWLAGPGLLALVLSTSCGGTAIRPKSDAGTNIARADGAEPEDGAGPDGSDTGSGGAAGATGGAGGTSSASGGAPGSDGAASGDAVATDGAWDGASDAIADGAAGPGDVAADGVIADAADDAAADAAAGGTTGAGAAGGSVSGAGGATAGAGGATAGAGGATAGAGGATAGAGGATAGAGGTAAGAGGTGAGGSTPDGAVADVAPPTTDAIVSCGGVRCPALFNLVATCRPTGACIRGGNVSATLSCYDNGVRVRSHLELGRGLVIDVTKPDGVSPCYSMDVGAPTGGRLRPAIVHSPDGAEIARGLADPNDGGLVTITCDGVTADLQDRSCLVDPGVGNCAAGTCQ